MKSINYTIFLLLLFLVFDKSICQELKNFYFQNVTPIITNDLDNISDNVAILIVHSDFTDLKFNSIPEEVVFFSYRSEEKFHIIHLAPGNNYVTFSVPDFKPETKFFALNAGEFAEIEITTSPQKPQTRKKLFLTTAPEIFIDEINGKIDGGNEIQYDFSDGEIVIDIDLGKHLLEFNSIYGSCTIDVDITENQEIYEETIVFLEQNKDKPWKSNFGDLLISSEPADVAIFINDSLSGRTNSIFKSLPIGFYTVRLERLRIMKEGIIEVIADSMVTFHRDMQKKTKKLNITTADTVSNVQDTLDKLPDKLGLIVLTAGPSYMEDKSCSYKFDGTFVGLSGMNYHKVTALRFALGFHYGKNTYENIDYEILMPEISANLEYNIFALPTIRRVFNYNFAVKFLAGGGFGIGYLPLYYRASSEVVDIINDDFNRWQMNHWSWNYHFTVGALIDRKIGFLGSLYYCEAFSGKRKLSFKDLRISLLYRF